MSNTYIDLNSLIENHNYIPTDEFNGMAASKGRQALTVTRAVRVPATWNNNPNIIGKAICTGKRGAKYSALIMKSADVDGNERLAVVVL